MKSTDYTQMGIAAMLPGMQHMIDLMQDEMDRLRAQLQAMQNGAGFSQNGKRLGRPPDVSKFDSWSTLSPQDREARRKHLSDVKRGLKPAKTGWSADPAERRKEMLRRRSKWSKEALARQAKGASSHWKGKQASHQGSGGKAFWAKLTPEQRSQEMKRRYKVAKAKREAAA